MTVQKGTTLDTIMSKLVHKFGLGTYLNDIDGFSSATQFSDNRLVSRVTAPTHYRGSWVRIWNTSTPADGEIRQVSNYDPLTGTISVFPGFSYIPAADTNVEIWRLYDPSQALIDIEHAMREVPADQYIHIDEITQLQNGVLRGESVFVVVDVISGIALNGYINVIINGDTYSEYVSSSEKLYSVRFVVDYRPTTSNYMNVLVSVPSGAYKTRLVVPYRKTFTIQTTSIAYPSDIIEIYEDVHFMSYQIPSHTYLYDISAEKVGAPVNGWSLADHETLVLPHHQKGLLYARVHQPVNTINYIQFQNGSTIYFFINEEILLAMTAYNIFTRMRSLAAPGQNDTRWIDSQIIRAAEIIGRETRDENQRIRSTTKRSRDVEYTLGNTYLGAAEIW